jgi:hypothetical protein
VTAASDRLAGPLPVTIGLLGCALFAAGMAPVPDHGWQFHLAGRVLDGARLYVDIGAADMHPPLFTWIAIAIEAVGRLIGVSGLRLYHGAVAIAIAGSLFACWRIGLRSYLAMAALLLVLFPFAGACYGQGEHLALILALPYLVASARVADGETLTPRVAIGTAIAAAVGLALKPYFALVWIGVEVWLAVLRGRRSLLRGPSLTIGALFVAYVAATALLTPEFFGLLPWLMELYPRFAPVPLVRIALDPRTLLLAGALAGARLTPREPVWWRFADLASIAALAMFATVLLQGKGWGYHWYPVTALSLVLLVVAFRPRLERVRLVPAAAALAAVLWMVRTSEDTARLLASPPVELPQLMEAVEPYEGTGTIVVYSALLHPGFPLVNLMRVGWASPYGHLWMVPAMYPAAWRRSGPGPFPYRQAGEWADFERDMFDRLWRDVERDDPDVLLVEAPLGNGFDMREYLATDPRFRARLDATHYAGTAGHYRVFRKAALRTTVLPAPAGAARSREPGT